MAILPENEREFEMIEVYVGDLKAKLNYKCSKYKGKHWNAIQKLRAEKIVENVYREFFRRVAVEFQRALLYGDENNSN